MTELFENDKDDLLDDDFIPDDKVVAINASESIPLDARRRLEKMLEEKRLQDELDDFIDY